METHGVKRLRIAAAPAPAEFRPPREWSTLAVKNFIAAFALGAILLIYSGTQYMRMKKVERRKGRRVQGGWKGAHPWRAWPYPVPTL